MEVETTQHNRTSLLSRVTALAVATLLVAFFAVTMNNMTTISSQVESIKSGPYPVSVAAGRVETLLVQLRTVALRPMYLNTEEAASDIQDAYETVDGDMREKLAFIADNHTLNAEDAHTLQTGYDLLAQRQDTFVEMCASPLYTDQEVNDYAQDQLYPLIDELLDVDIIILDESTAAVNDIYTTVNAAIRQTILVSCVLMAAVALSLIFYTYTLHRKNQSEKLLRENLEDALVLAQSASAAKSAFLANMSHDIRTPLNAIMGLTSIASAHIDEPRRVEECLNRISTSSKHLLGLVNDVLDMGKIESGKITLKEEPFSFPTFIDEFVAIAQPQAVSKGLQFDVSVGDINQKMLVGDSMRLSQILLNLVSNAIKYTPEGGSVRITVSEEELASRVHLTPRAQGNSQNESSYAPSHEPSHALPYETADKQASQPTDRQKNCRYYRFVVQDTGVGMNPDFLSRVFDPFERERTDITNFTEGTGLGMAITKNIVELMGGEINVESTPGVGSTFTVVIPLKAASHKDACIQTTEEAPGQAIACGHVLLVEDNELNREIATELIESFGATVDVAVDGLEALEVIKADCTSPYDLIFMDWQMPRMNGIEATQAIVAYEREGGLPHTPIVAMTANAFNEDRQRALQAGMDDFMTKPIDLAKLEQVLRRYLG